MTYFFPFYLDYGRPAIRFSGCVDGANMQQNVCGRLSERMAFLLAKRLYVFRLSKRPVRFAGTRDFRHSSRRKSSGEKAGVHTVTYSAPSGSGCYSASIPPASQDCLARL
jgi:hypothetical protein